MSEVPAVSIGMPVHNAEEYLPATIGAILAQDFRDFELIISDNASTDRSAEICERFARQDGRVRFVRQPRNLGATVNFRFVLDQARAPLFMWAAADDMRSPDFLTQTVTVLRRRPDAIAANCRTRFDNGIFERKRMGDGPIEHDDPAQRVLAFFGYWHANGRYYSLFRREALMRNQALHEEEYLASDWAVVLELLKLGKVAQADGGELILGSRGMSSRNLFRYYHRSVVDYVLPLWKFWRFTERLSATGFTAGQRFRLRMRVVGLNIEFVRWRLKQALRARAAAKRIAPAQPVGTAPHD
ncbi:MAG: glycosyltransferase family 2 protein [Alphaproteobacteria bacterium]|nr:glycosyltransferase family 2 protein [Alphaproteobacteria bacterium]MCW5744209.1 glycosyltransferase family 2 protein [Alphaproteobacteria bacterium]